MHTEELSNQIRNAESLYELKGLANDLRLERDGYFDSLAQAHDRLAQVLRIMDDLVEPDPCWFDHHGGCQAHGYSLASGEKCPHQEAKDLLAS